MRLEKNKLSHWLIYFISCFNIVFGTFLTLFFFKKRKNKIRIILTGHKFNGNIKSFYDYIKDSKNEEVEIRYITPDLRYYKQLKARYKKLYTKDILTTLSILDILYVCTSGILISTHNSPIFYLLRKLNKKIKFIDVYHAIFYNENFIFLQDYDFIFASSPLLKQFYINEWGYKESQVKSIGYSRVDPLINKTYNRYKLFKKYKIDEKAYNNIILFAPTWQQDAPGRKLFPFNTDENGFLGTLSKFCKKNKSLLIFRTHLNSDYKLQSTYSNMIYLPFAEYPDTEEILYITDILVTDWATIAFDFIVLRRPLIYLDVPVPFKNGFKALQPEDRPGYIVDSLQSLVEKLQIYIEDPSHYLKKFGHDLKRVILRAHEKNADGNASKRYLEEIKKLVNRR